jgi:hypothetical protein
VLVSPDAPAMTCTARIRRQHVFCEKAARTGRGARDAFARARQSAGAHWRLLQPVAYRSANGQQRIAQATWGDRQRSP